ncbi:MAG: tripartite tricarboxylate transporter substrate binding protein [Betaproteobacteria bacterium]|jgi:tripartite-type tricarboxylate transporter receptor subunit TctC
MKKSQYTRLVLSLFLLNVCAPYAQSYPTKSIRLIVPLAAGGNVDIVARAIAQPMAEALGQTVIVDNRPSASSLVGTQMVAKAPADGYTILAIANTFATVPSVMPNPGYDPIKDFAGVSLTCLVPQLLVSNPSLPVRNVKELIALAKRKPGELAWSTSGTAGTGHMAGELFSRQAGIKLLHVPYKGNAPALIDVIAGQVQLMFDQVSTSQPYVLSGKLRPLGVTSLTRSALFPQVPTIDESGLKGFEDITFNGLVVPIATPRDIKLRIQSEVVRIVHTKDLHQRFLERGIELASSASPEAFGDYVVAEFDKKGKLAREAGIKMD